jgi:hypothetical protein
MYNHSLYFIQYSANNWKDNQNHRFINGERPGPETAEYLGGSTKAQVLFTSNYSTESNLTYIIIYLFEVNHSRFPEIV